MENRDNISAIDWKKLGSELVYTQNRSGKYLSFYWKKAQSYKISADLNTEQSLESRFTPNPPEAYLEKIARVIDRQIPEQCQWQFNCQGKLLWFELVITPVWAGEGEVSKVLVLGYLLSSKQGTSTNHNPVPVSPEPYQKLLAQIVRKIRRSLNLETIWQETVNNLGETLKVSRCLMIYCNSLEQRFEVKAEYRQESYPSLLGIRFDIASQPYWQQAISSHEPVVVEQITPKSSPEKSLLILSTFYQDQRNGIICLQQCDYARHWSSIEIDLLQKIADQVGTAIAHATLYQELAEARKEAEEASRYKSDFLTNTSHELRTPLSGVIGFLNLILDGIATEPEEQRQFTEQAYKSAIILHNLINEILDIAKIESGTMELELNTVSLSQLFQEVDQFIAPQAANKGLHFHIKHPSTYDEVIVYANHQRLLQIMLNLINNAIKFTHEGGIFVSADVISQRYLFQDQEFPGIVKISVADTGIGVPLHKQDKLFQNFVQIDGSRIKRYPGTGLGLAISKKLVEAMGGKISFYSMGENLGSTVTFTIPLNHVPVLKTVSEVP